MNRRKIIVLIVLVTSVIIWAAVSIRIPTINTDIMGTWDLEDGTTLKFIDNGCGYYTYKVSANIDEDAQYSGTFMYGMNSITFSSEDNKTVCKIRLRKNILDNTTIMTIEYNKNKYRMTRDDSIKIHSGDLGPIVN